MPTKDILIKLVPIIAFFILLFIYVKLVGPIPLTINSVNTDKTDAFTVTGVGEVDAKPDTATLNLGVAQSSSSVETAQNNLNSSINTVLANIKSLGIEDKDIQTTNYNISPQYSPNQQITGYSASTNLTIHIHDLSRVSDVIDTATKSGANQIGGINFEVGDPSKAQNEARLQAIRQAQTKAQNAAQIAGFKLGPIINYKEDFSDASQPVPLLDAAKSVQSSAGTNIQSGSSQIKVTVTLSYDIF